MNNQEYEQKKRECWEEYVNMLRRNDATRYVFDKIFDRAFALGKPTETVTQEEIESEAKDYSYNIGDSDWERLRVRDAFVDGANFALGKQEKDADTVISGWIFVDETTFDRILCVRKVTQGDYEAVWDSGHPEFCLGEELFPDMDSGSDPIEVEIIIKRKKNE